MSRFTIGERVVYVPRHARGRPDHPDREHGTVTRADPERVFVSFDSPRTPGAQGSPQACDPRDLLPERDRRTLRKP